MKLVNGDILSVDYGIIIHQVNCQLVMGSGLALQIRNKYPHVFREYVRIGSKFQPQDRLGKCVVTEAISRRLYVANLFGQYHYLPRGVAHTNYTALSMALNSMVKWYKMYGNNASIYIPYKIGCGLGGGDWNVVVGIIRTITPNAIIVRRES